MAIWNYHLKCAELLITAGAKLNESAPVPDKSVGKITA